MTTVKFGFTHDRAVPPRADGERLRLLLDSNVVIATEPYAGTLEPNVGAAVDLLRLANEQGQLLCIASATHDDLARASDPAKRAQRLAELKKFHTLEEVPVSSALVEAAGGSAPGSNDERDLRILAALDAGAATYLVTEDSRLRKRADRARLGERVLSLNDAVELLRAFQPSELRPPPRVVRLKAYALDTEDPIFDGLRSDYGREAFDAWLRRVRRESDLRPCYIIESENKIAGLALLKPEEPCEYELPEPVVKITTFKVADHASGLRYGELLLKAILNEHGAGTNGCLYVEVLDTHPEVIEFLAAFGFTDSGHRSSRNELVLAKVLVAERPDQMSDLEYQVAIGPPALLCRQGVYFVPIEPHWHDQLFPEQAPTVTSTQLSFFTEPEPVTYPWGNALRKAYLCNAPNTQLREGDALLFYLSAGAGPTRRPVQTVSAVGIVEGLLRSSSVHEILSFVGRRTVYSPQEIASLARSVRGVLAIRFRQDRFLEPPLGLEELQRNGALIAWPQSITAVRDEGDEWIRGMLRESP